MSPETRALVWKEGRQLRWTLLLTPVSLVVAAWCASKTPMAGLLSESYLLSIGPLLAAAIGAMGMAEEQVGSGLGWLRSRSISPGRILAIKLGWQLCLLVTCALLVALIGSGWPAVALGDWGRSIDAPTGPPLIGWALLLWCASFTWGAALSWLSESRVAVPLGAAFLAWAQALILLGPASAIGGRAEEAMSQLPWLIPGFLLPPLLLAIWAFRRWNPLADAFPLRRALLIVGVALTVCLATWAISLRPALQTRSLQRELRAGVGPSASTTLPHALHEVLVARQHVLQDGTTRVSITDGEASLVLLPRGTTIVEWMSDDSPDLLVRWPGGQLRLVDATGATSEVPASHRKLREYRLKEGS